MTAAGVVVGGAAVVLALSGLAVVVGLRRSPLTRIAQGEVPPDLRPAMAAMSSFGYDPRHLYPAVFDHHLLGAVIDLARRGYLRLEPADDSLTVEFTHTGRGLLNVHENVIVEAVISCPSRRCGLRDLVRSAEREIQKALLVEYHRNGWRRRGYGDGWWLLVALVMPVLVALLSLMAALGSTEELPAGQAMMAGAIGRGGAALVAAAAVITFGVVLAYIFGTDGHAVTRKGLRTYNDLSRLEEYLALQTSAALDGDPQAVRVLRDRLPWVVAFGFLSGAAGSAGARRTLLDDIEADDEGTEGSEAGEPEPELDEETEHTPGCEHEVTAVREICQHDRDRGAHAFGGEDDRAAAQGKRGSIASHEYDWSGAEGPDHDWGFND
ncbi:MAG: DUF2207 family protein [Nocardioidaceae bacterium]